MNEFIAKTKRLLNKLQLFLLKQQFNNAKRQELLIQLSFLLKAGVPPSNALEHMSEIYRADNNVLMQAVVDAMFNNIKSGKKLGDDLQQWFPYEICRVLSISDEKGFLLQAINNLIKYFASSRSALKSLVGIVPGLVYFIVILCFIAFTGTKLLPQLGVMVKQWPAASLALRYTGTFLYYNYYLIIIFIVLMIIWVVISLRDYTGKAIQVVALPFLSTYKLHLSILLFKSLSMLTGNGVAVSDAIKILLLNRTRGFLYYKLREMVNRVKCGDAIGEVLDTGIFTSNQIAHLKIISQYCSESEYAKVFAILGEQSDHELSKRMQIISKIMNLLFMVLTAFGVVWVYGAYALLISSIT